MSVTLRMRFCRDISFLFAIFCLGLGLTGETQPLFAQSQERPAQNRAALGNKASNALSNATVTTQETASGLEASDGQNDVTPESEMPATSSLSPELQTKLQVAVDQFNQSNIMGALEELKKICQEYPELQPPRIFLAQWFSQLKNSNAVRTSLEWATQETPNDPEAYMLLGEISLRQGQLTAAELLFQRGEENLNAYSTNPTRQKSLFVVLWKNQARLAQLRQHWPVMQEKLAKLLQVQGESAELCQLAAISFFEQNQEDAARQWFQKAENLGNGAVMPADALMAQLFLRKNDPQKASSYLNNALKTHPDSADVLSLSILMAINQNDLETAWASAQKLYQQSPDSLNVQKTYGNVALFRSDYPEAERVFTEVVHQHPLDTEAVNGLALALCEQNDPAKKQLALQYAASNVQKQNNQRDFLATLGWALYQNGQKEEARSVLQQSFADGQINASTAYYLAMILLDSAKDEPSQLNPDQIASITEDAKKLLQAANSNKTPYFKRQAVEQLLAQLP